jgi:Fe-S-cluster containining protein
MDGGEKRGEEPGSSVPWYASGLRFECQSDCGACCTDHGDAVYVYLTDADVVLLAAHLGLGRGEFLRRYTERDDGDLVLVMNGPDCPFLRGSRCSVYPARPVQCSSFPFWAEHLASPRSWANLREFCPGIDVGEPHALRTVERHLASRRRDVSDDWTEREHDP